MTDFSKLVLPRKHLKNEMVISCTVKGYHSSRLNQLDLRFQRLPKDEDNSYKVKWLDYPRCNRDCPEDKNFFLCLLHFEL